MLTSRRRTAIFLATLALALALAPGARAAAGAPAADPGLRFVVFEDFTRFT